MLLSIFSLADQLDMEWLDVHDGHERGAIPRGLIIGDRVRWRQSDIDEWVAAGCPVGAELSDDECRAVLDAQIDELKALGYVEKKGASDSRRDSA